MTIPGDSLNRWWTEASGSNPGRVADLRPALLAIVAFGSGLKPIIAGSGFILAGSSNYSAVITAKHVLLEGVFRVQKPNPSYSPSAIIIPKSQTLPSIDPKKLKIAWMGAHSAAMLDVRHVSFNDSTDIASCIVTTQLDESIKPNSLPLDTSVPCHGDEIHLISLDNLNSKEMVPPTDRLGSGRKFELETRVSIRVGVVTGVHLNGLRQYRWPCFTTSIPVEPGMSGGLAFKPSEGKTISACGIICADNSTVEARSNPNVCGESVVACAWSALALRLPNSLPITAETETHTLFEFYRSGSMPMAVGGIDHIEMIELGNGDFRIRLP